MFQIRFVRAAKMLFSGAFLVQAAGCIPSLPDLLGIVDTILLGVTAAGSLAILDNI